MSEMNLPEHWKTARLGEITDIFKEVALQSVVWRNIFKVISLGQIPTDINALDSALYIDAYGYPYFRRRHLVKALRGKTIASGNSSINEPSDNW